MYVIELPLVEFKLEFDFNSVGALDVDWQNTIEIAFNVDIYFYVIIGYMAMYLIFDHAADGQYFGA
jgi:hypothetical protein